MTFNLKSLAIAPTADMPLRDASGEPQYDGTTPLTITLYGPGSKEHQKAKHAKEKKHNERLFSRMQGKSDGMQSAEEANAERADFLAACTKSFNGFAVEGKTGFEAFKSIYADIEIGHIADDADKYIGERANFKKPSAPR